MEALLPLILFAAFYLLMVRPQQQRVKRQRAMVLALAVGDEIITVGGIIGRIVSIEDERLGLKVADGVVIDVVRAAVGQRLLEEEPASTGVDDPTDSTTADSPHDSGVNGDQQAG